MKTTTYNPPRAPKKVQKWPPPSDPDQIACPECRRMAKEAAKRRRAGGGR